MTKRVEAIYENGVLRPLEPVNLAEHQRVTVTLNEPEEDWLDTEILPLACEGLRAANPIP